MIFITYFDYRACISILALNQCYIVAGTGAWQLDTSTLQTFLATANYGYDELGNLIRDRQEEIASIEWTVYGKIKKVSRTTGSSKADLEFGYDAGGNRLWKKIIPKGSGAIVKTYYYLRDAQGTEMCRYISYTNTSSQTLLVSEEHGIYGSSRLGMDQRRDTLFLGGAYNPTWCGISSARRELGNKHYELSNHLGNVLLSVTDKKAYKTLSGSLYFEAEITTISDYYPFGSAIQTRAYRAVEYRWGFNNQEKDGELGEAYAFEYRMHDARLGRFLSVDPDFNRYPMLSPFLFANNDPIRNIDFFGKGPGDRVKKAASFIGTKYSQNALLNQGADLRSGESADALKYIDCSELVCRVLFADKITPAVELMNTSSLVPFLGNKSKFHCSDIPKSGDIFLWRTEGENAKGHTGIVESYDELTGIVAIIHAKGEDYGTIRDFKTLTYFTGHVGWKGFYRPISESSERSALVISNYKCDIETWKFIKNMWDEIGEKGRSDYAQRWIDATQSDLDNYINTGEERRSMPDSPMSND